MLRGVELSEPGFLGLTDYHDLLALARSAARQGQGIMVILQACESWFRQSRIGEDVLRGEGLSEPGFLGLTDYHDLLALVRSAARQGQGIMGIL